MEAPNRLTRSLEILWAVYGEPFEKTASESYFYGLRKPDLDREALGEYFCKVAQELKQDPWDLAQSVVDNLSAYSQLAKTSSDPKSRRLAQYYVNWAEETEKRAFIGALAGGLGRMAGGLGRAAAGIGRAFTSTVGKGMTAAGSNLARAGAKAAPRAAAAAKVAPAAVAKTAPTVAKAAPKVVPGVAKAAPTAAPAAGVAKPAGRAAKKATTPVTGQARPLPEPTAAPAAAPTGQPTNTKQWRQQQIADKATQAQQAEATAAHRQAAAPAREAQRQNVMAKAKATDASGQSKWQAPKTRKEQAVMKKGLQEKQVQRYGQEGSAAKQKAIHETANADTSTLGHKLWGGAALAVPAGVGLSMMGGGGEEAPQQPQYGYQPQQGY